MQRRVFYSWQSDTRGAANRNLIQQALEGAAGEIADEAIGIEPVVDRDTANVPGSPDIGTTILAKIGNADVVVADVTIVNGKDAKRPMPNPNVMLEIGYSLAVLTDARLILVQNTAFGGPELLPFDLRQKRVLKYHSEQEATERAQSRRELQHALRHAIEMVLIQTSPRSKTQSALSLKLGFKTDAETSSLHEYRLRVGLNNTSTARVEKWHVDIILPRRVVRDEEIRKALKEQSNKETLVFRFDEKSNGSFYPGDGKVLQVLYRMNDEIFDKHQDVLDQLVRVRAYANDEHAGSIERPFKELQRF